MAGNVDGIGGGGLKICKNFWEIFGGNENIEMKDGFEDPRNSMANLIDRAKAMLILI